jgi:hypothetical protein
MRSAGKAATQPRKALLEWIARRDSQLEGEEMQVDVPGFKGGDHTSLDLPAEEELLKALDNPGEPFVAVRGGSGGGRTSDL